MNDGGSDTAPLQMENGSIGMVNTFPHLRSNIANDGKITSEVASQTAKASRAFGCLRKPIFQNPNLSVSTKSCLLCCNLISFVVWSRIKAPYVRRLRSFHNRCIRTILGVSKYQQWRDRITS